MKVVRAVALVRKWQKLQSYPCNLGCDGVIGLDGLPPALAVGPGTFSCSATCASLVSLLL